MEVINRKKVQQARDSIRYMNGSDITYAAIKQALDEVIENYGIDAVVEEATLYGGGLFSKEESCLALVNPNHRYDYFKFCIVKKDAGKTCTVDVYSFGQSKNIKHEEFAANTRVFDGSGTMGTVGGMLAGGAVGAGFAIGSAVTGVAKAGFKAVAKGINALMRDPQALEEENAWYSAVYSIFNEVIS